MDVNDFTITDLKRINFQIEILVFDKRIDPLRQNALQVTLAWSAAGISGHHPGNRGVCPQE